MSKPEDIPQDVWDAVENWAGWDGDNFFATVEEALARAIMAAKAQERQRCASIAENYSAVTAPASDGMGTQILRFVDGRDIAKSIRGEG